MTQIESFFLGIIAALGALVVELIVFIGLSSFTNFAPGISFLGLFMLPQMIIVGAFIEEAFKYIVIAKRVDEISLGRSYLTNSLFVGLGFLATELLLIFESSSLPQARIIAEIATIHIGTAGIIGYIVATKNPKKISSFLFAIIIATIFHASYNLLVLNRTQVANYTIFALLGVVIFINIMNLLRINRSLAQD